MSYNAINEAPKVLLANFRNDVISLYLFSYYIISLIQFKFRPFWYPILYKNRNKFEVDPLLNGSLSTYISNHIIMRQSSHAQMNRTLVFLRYAISMYPLRNARVCAIGEGTNIIIITTPLPLMQST